MEGKYKRTKGKLYLPPGLSLLLLLALVSGVLVHAPQIAPRWVLNLSESMEAGVYSVEKTNRYRVGDIVLIAQDKRLKEVGSTREWLSKEAPLLKRIKAFGPTRICLRGRTVILGKRSLGLTTTYDHMNRRIPRFRGCRRVATEEAIVLGDNGVHSFDSRYFGPIRISQLKGRGVLVWPF